VFPDEADDDESSEFCPPVPAEDRLWRHPSEIGAERLTFDSLPLVVGSSPSPPHLAPPRRSRSSTIGLVVVAGMVGATAALAAMVVAGGLRPRIIERDRPSTATSATGSAADPVNASTVANLVEKLDRSVVRIEATVAYDTRRGAAVAVSETLVVTSAALVEGASNLTVRTPDSVLFDAELVGVDTVTGLAVLKVDGADLVPAPDADDQPGPGDPAITMAGSVGGEADVSMSIISSVDGTLDGPRGTMRDLISFDRPLPTTSDGAALLDADGAALGICLRLDDGDSQRGYAVPMDVARDVAQALEDGGSVRHAWMGVHGVDLPGKDAMAYEVPGGGLLTEVTPDGPAEQAGLREGDVVLSMGDRTIRSISDLAVAIREAEPDQAIAVTYLRDGVRSTMTVTMGTTPT
jgi:S1-C subfamily serine protease